MIVMIFQLKRIFQREISTKIYTQHNRKSNRMIIKNENVLRFRNSKQWIMPSDSVMSWSQMGGRPGGALKTKNRLVKWCLGTVALPLGCAPRFRLVRSATYRHVYNNVCVCVCVCALSMGASLLFVFVHAVFQRDSRPCPCACHVALYTVTGGALCVLTVFLALRCFIGAVIPLYMLYVNYL